MQAVNNYIIVQKIKQGPKTVGGLILTEDTDVDNRYIKAEIISTGNLVEGIKEKDIVYYDKTPQTGSIFLEDASFSFDYAHILPLVEKCSILHGHTSSVMVELVGQMKNNLLVDFGVAKKIIKEVMEPTMQGLISDGSPYLGFLYAGLMIKDGELKVLEFNCRFGDPETQPILLRLDYSIRIDERCDLML